MPANRPTQQAISTVPLDSDRARRARLRRGGPRTPLPLLPLIAICAGIALAYVSQTAHATQATYEATTLVSEHSQLQTEADRLSDELGRLRSGERIVASAQGLGMRPAGQWAYVAAAPAPVIPAPARLADANQPPRSDPVQQLIAALSGAFGPQDAEAAGR